VPTETVKQRLQLGYYRNAQHCLERIVAKGGTSLFRSMPTTLAMNVPYNSLMMMCNESLRKWLNPSGDFNFKGLPLLWLRLGRTCGGRDNPARRRQDGATDSRPAPAHCGERLLARG
jgi:hypothetical protein